MRHCRPRELQERLRAASPSPQLLDVREPWEFALCRIEGAVNLPLRHLARAPALLEPRRETVVICHHGIRSRMAGHHLERMGFTDVVNLSGGVAAWASDIDAAMATY
jgi:rhodanese-related sulfurtransferase